MNEHEVDVYVAALREHLKTDNIWKESFAFGPGAMTTHWAIGVPVPYSGRRTVLWLYRDADVLRILSNCN